MRVLQVGKYYYPSVGGIETVVRTLSEGLARQGVQVTVLCFSKETHQTEKSRLNNVEIVRVPVHADLFSQPLSWQYLKSLLELAKSADLVHFHSPNPLAEALAPVLPRHIPMVVTYHSDVIRQRFLLPFYQPVLHRFLGRIDKIAIPSSYHLTHSKSLGLFSGKCQIVPFGVDLDTAGKKETLDTMVQQLKDRFGSFFLFVGRLVGYKGVFFLIEAMSLLKNQHPQLKLVIVGGGPLYESYKNQIERSDLKESVHLMGRIEDNTELRSYFQACDFLVLPSTSRAEAFGMVLLEAMNFSKPVITTRIDSGMMDINVENVTGFQVNAEDPVDLASAIVKLANQPELRTQMGAEAKLHAQSHYSVSQMIEGYLRIYEEAQQVHRK